MLSSTLKFSLDDDLSFIHSSVYISINLVQFTFPKSIGRNCILVIIEHILVHEAIHEARTSERAIHEAQTSERAIHEAQTSERAIHEVQTSERAIYSDILVMNYVFPS